jgi:hypothetical protein
MSDDFETFRDKTLSIYQSAVSDVARQIDARHVAGSQARSAVNRSASSVLPDYAAEIARREYNQKRGQALPSSSGIPAKRTLSSGDALRTCAELAFRYMKARLSGDVTAIAAVQGEFTASTCDPAWATTIEQYLLYFGPDGTRRPIPYVPAASVGAKTIAIKENAKIALAGDWGTGAQPAIQVLKNIADWNPDVFIHLGDIYYSGTATECSLNFESLIRSVLRSANPKLTVYSLSGNHDMYCGGVGYYELIKNLNPAPLNQTASFFCLRSTDEKWQLLAMDTGLHDYSPIEVDDVVTFLEDDELEWHCARLKEFPGRTILLSHHQLFSAFSPIGKPDSKGRRSPSNPKLVKAFNSMAASGRISAWFWGHEHTLSIYAPFAGLQRGRCLGHGAVPVSILDRIYDPVTGLEETPTVLPNTQLGQQGNVYAHGYAVLTLGKENCSAEYFQSVEGRAELVYSEIIE